LQTQEDDLFHDDANARHVEQHEQWWHAVKNEPDLCNKLLGTAVTWFLFDVLFYGNTLFEPIVLEAAFGHSKTTAASSHGGDAPNDDDSSSIELLRQAATDSLLLTSIVLLGCAVADYWIGRTSPCGLEQTPRYFMVQGFAVMTLLYLIIGYFWNELRRIPVLLVALYRLTFFFANYGPNMTTIVMPSLVYSPNCRSTLNGLCAAAGKFGAWTGATLFEPAADKFGDATIMMVCSCVAVLALGLTKAFVPVSPMSTTVAHLKVDRAEARERVGIV
jgi:PHS family inorganic phosphate transporter-like MFS transporter